MLGLKAVGLGIELVSLCLHRRKFTNRSTSPALIYLLSLGVQAHPGEEVISVESPRLEGRSHLGCVLS